MQLLSFAVLSIFALAPLVRCSSETQTTQPQPTHQANKKKIPLLNVHPHVTIARDFWSRFKGQ